MTAERSTYGPHTVETLALLDFLDQQDEQAVSRVEGLNLTEAKALSAAATALAEAAWERRGALISGRAASWGRT